MVEKANLPHWLDASIDFIAGSLGAVASVYVGQPLDTIKVKMQTFPEIYNRGAFDCFRQTWLKQGLAKGLYAGTGPALIANIAENSVLFAAYGVCQKIILSLHDSLHPSNVDKKYSSSVFLNEVISNSSNATTTNLSEKLSAFGNASAGAMAAIFSTLVLCPTELIKCKVQAYQENLNTQLKSDLFAHQHNASKPHIIRKIGPWYVTKEIFRTGGFPAFFKGIGPTFGREVPGYFCFFGGYEITRNLLTPTGKTKADIGVFGTISSGGMGGVCLWLAIFPFDVIKSRMQVLSGQNKFWPVAKDVITHQGFSGLYKGLGPTLLRTFPASGALFLTYEYVQNKLKQTAQTIR